MGGEIKVLPRTRARIKKLLPGARARIKTGALALFNAHGVKRVTTAEIAAAAGMREGNLHYHFARKGELVAALFEDLKAAALAQAAQPADAALEAGFFAAYQREWFDLMWTYRCFYRDGAEIVIVAPELRERIHHLRLRTQAGARGILERSVATGTLHATPEELTRLLDNIWIVSSYWMSYRRHGGADLTPEDLDWGFAQVSALVAPYKVSGAMHRI